MIPHCAQCEKPIQEGFGIVIVTIARLGDIKLYPISQDTFHLTCYTRVCPRRELKIKGVRFEPTPHDRKETSGG